jgi:hypothetical protein
LVRPMDSIIIALLALMLCCMPRGVFANDGFAALGVGGIALSKTDAIALKSEVLNISCDMITVNYEFLNESSQDVDAIIIFPLPPYPAFPAQSHQISHGEPSEFAITVNGKAVSFDTELKAILNGRDVTEELTALGITRKQIAHFPFDLSNLENDRNLPIPQKQIDTLTQKGLVVDGYPVWDIHVRYVWKQKFPAKDIVHVDHKYRPFIAEGTLAGYPGHVKSTDYCLTDDQIRRLDKLSSVDTNLNIFQQVPGSNLEYILTTANTWKDGIRDFKLSIHAKAEDEIIATCFPAILKKVSATTYEAQIDNFQPKTELRVFYGNANKCLSNGYGSPPTYR